MKGFYRTISAVGVAGFVLLAGHAQATTYSGNGDTGFGGAIGTGSLTLTDDGTTISGTLTRGSGFFNDSLVIYIDSVSGGFTTTSGFTDAGDGLRKSISGFDGGSNRSTLNFQSGFLPDYAIALGPANESFGGLWQLVNGGSHSFIASVSLSPLNNSAATYTFSFSVTQIGLTPNSGATFKLLGTYISNTGFRSTEAIAGNVSGTQGWNTFTQTAGATYTIVPEPTTYALVAAGLLGGLLLRRRKV
jgi:hypothetical protein